MYTRTVWDSLPRTCFRMAILPFDLHNLCFNMLAASTFFFWDYCLTFGDEASGVNLEVRYLTVVIAITGCLVWAWLESIIGYLIFLGVEMLLVIRLHALYGRPKGFLVALCALFVAMHGAAFIFLGIELSQMVLIPTPSDIPSKFLRVPCLGIKIPKLFPYYWILGLAYDSVLFFLLIGMWIYKRFLGMDSGGLVQVLVRDGAWAFFTVFGLTALIRVASALLVWSVTQFTVNLNSGVGAIALAWLHASLGVVGSRLVLNLRAANRERSSSISEYLELHIADDPSKSYSAGAVDVD
ncbi:hypothetical protein BU17DRAFT_67771 [Hysterangium stoloniferum]|nr:hypothetical protein BU17DRAFT_67771 [Hysterangium stoloniferum]